MIKSIAEYRHVKINDGIKINGNILPQRDVAGNGSWQDLTGEDLAFCIEAAFERAITADTERPVVSSAGKQIDSRAWRSVASSLNDAVTHFVNDDFEFTAKERHGTYANDPVSYIYEGSALTRDDILSRMWEDFDTTKTFKADAVRRVFHDLALLRRVLFDKTSFHVKGDVSVHTGWKDGTMDVYAAVEFPTIVHHSAVNWKGTTLEGMYGTNRSYLDFEWFVALPTDGKSTEYCSQASGDTVVLVEFECTRITVETKGAVMTSRRTRLVPFTCYCRHTDPEGVRCAIIPFAEINREANRFGENFGGYTTGAALNGYSSLDVQVQITSARFVSRLGPNTDFSGTGWFYGE